MSNIKNLIFDLDGTLIKLPVDWRAAYNKVRDETGKLFSSLIELYSETWNTKLYEKISRIVEEYELEAAKSFQILDNSDKLILELSRKYRLGLVTLQGKNVALKILSEMGILEKFEVVITRNDAPARLLQLKNVINEANFDPRETLVVGDRDADVEAALKLGCWAVLVDRKGKAERYDEPEQRFFIVYSLQKIPEIITAIEA